MKRDIINNLSSIVIVVVTLLCCWAIIAIDLQLIPLINTSFSESFAVSLNRVYTNLSYSYFAGCVFYLLTVVLPYRNKRKRVMPVIRRRIKDVIGSLENIMLEFSRNTQINHRDFDESKCREMLMSKSWTANIPMFQQMYRANISYVKFISEESNTMDKNITNLIDLYCDFLSADQMTALEDLRKKEIWRQSRLFSVLNVNIDDPNGKEHMIGEFLKAIITAKEIENLFNIKRKLS